jgi:hypothetical protein
MTTHVTIDNDGHYTVDVVTVDTLMDGTRAETHVATLKPGEKTAPHRLYLHSSRHVEVRECQPMRKD